MSLPVWLLELPADGEPLPAMRRPSISRARLVALDALPAGQPPASPANTSRLTAGEGPVAPVPSSVPPARGSVLVVGEERGL